MMVEVMIGKTMLTSRRAAMDADADGDDRARAAVRGVA
jgi:hypothetical protein